MLSLFSSKIYYKDLTHNAVDIHCHLLPGLDDGATDMEMSLKMTENYLELGYQKVICTPHIMEDHFNLNASKIGTALNDLQQETKVKGYELHLEAAAEHMTDGQFEHLLKTGELLPLYNDMVLIETGFLAAPLNLKQLLFEMTNAGYTPVLAHPERYSYLSKPEQYKRLKDRGCLLQVNALSLTGYYGKSIQQKAEFLVEKGFADVMGTDAHHERHLQRLLDFKVNNKFAKQLEVVIGRTNELFG
ncbi:tyrosine-protein phosphatase [Robertkochia flava]|uniref:tyrosine-protein phosphatase n=1 Tax=Robertkochia flava TaxID=3447986 RepID=UPI001CCE4D15|nr:CpsB/CapC family capsule biosynthesis tyrosine phosphatase [Robertkochia marina]